MYTPFGYTGHLRSGIFNQQPNNFGGLQDRLGNIEQMIKSLTGQFQNFQTPTQQENVGSPQIDNMVNTPTSTAPEPMEPTPPASGIESLEQPVGGKMTPGIGQSASKMMMLTPGMEGFTPLTQEQWGGAQDKLQKRQNWQQFASSASEATGGAMKPMGYAGAFQDWLGADQSQGLGSFLQNYDFNLPPEQMFLPGVKPGLGQGMAHMMTPENFTPEYKAWQDKQNQNPITQATYDAMGGHPYASSNPGMTPFGVGMNQTYDQYLQGVQNWKPQGQGNSLQGPTQQNITKNLGLGSLVKQQGYQV